MFWVILFLVGIIFLYESISNVVELHNLQNGKYLEYQGQYSFQKKEYWRNTNYIFTLKNGHSIVVVNENSVFADDILQTHMNLKFKYTSHVDVFKGKRTAVYISTIDDKTILLQIDDAITDLRLGAIVCLIISSPCIIIPLIVILCEFKLYKALKKKKRQGKDRGRFRV